MIGSGRSSIAEICDISRANAADGHATEAVEALQSLGGGGMFASNQERDLHRWTRNLYGTRLETYTVPFLLHVSGRKTL